MTFGQATQAGRALFVAVGTGCGSAFGVNGFLAEEGTPGVPPNGYFYNAPFRDSCVDDYISRRGLEKLSGEMLGVPLMVVRLLNASPPGTNGPKPVSGALVNSCAMHCSRRSKHSVRTRSAWGDIDESATLFLHPLEKLCTNKKITLYITQDTSLRTMQGLTRAASR